MNFNVLIFMVILIRGGQILCYASILTANSPSSFSAFNQQISEVITKLDLILSSCAQSPYGPDDSGSGAEGISGENLSSLISEIRSDVEALRNDLLGLKQKPEGDAVEQPSLDELSGNNAAEGESECSFGEAELIGTGRTLLQYLQRIDFNVLLGKPSYASSTYPTTTIDSAVDGNFVSIFRTNKESTPWFYVDLQAPHLIWEITINLRELSSAGGLRIYVAKRIEFDTYGYPDERTLPLFASQVGNSRTVDLKYTYAGGMCGRYVIVKREMAIGDLVFYEIQGVGFKF